MTGTAAFVTGTSATLNVQFQYAIDTGAAGNYLPGSWLTAVETGAISAANLTASTVIARFPWLPAFPFSTRPRFLRLYFVIPSGDSFTTGVIASAIPTFVRDDQNNKYAAANYTVA